jgi:putative membrane protein insertion efficiency factor
VQLLRRIDRLAVEVWVFCLKCYRSLIAPLLAGGCRFEPSCSNYSEEAVRRHGALWGLWFTVRRLSRCHPFNACGYDPVPDRVDLSGHTTVTRNG